MKRIDYVISSSTLGHVSRYAFESLEQALAGAGLQGRRSVVRSTFSRRAVSAFYRVGLARGMVRLSSRAILVPMMGLQEHAVYPWAQYMEVVPFIFDCMPIRFTQWAAFFRRNRVSTAVFTASAAVEHFNAVMPEGRWLWVPEALQPDEYRSDVSWDQRQIDVLEYGRRYEKYHLAIRTKLASSGYVHTYERAKGQLVFATKADLVHGLSNARISICFPQSMTHPERFGQVETLTQRYLECMASGCLLLGHAPAEMVRLFGYDPVVKADWSDPLAQIEELLREPDRHAPLRARNLATVRGAGSWSQRGRELVELLARHGYGIADSSVPRLV